MVSADIGTARTHVEAYGVDDDVDRTVIGIFRENIMEPYSLADYDYQLPKDLIAQTPATRRQDSRLLYLNRSSGKLSHHLFYQLMDWTTDKDVLVLNNTKVIPGRLFGRKETGGKIEALLVDYAGGKKITNGFIGQCLVRASKRPKLGSMLHFEEDLSAEVIGDENGVYTLKFMCDDFESIINRIGRVPLPPYIRRESDAIKVDDHISYQTVYASQKGAVAAPTAGLHFDRKLLKRLQRAGIKIAEITLHVGYGTFLPVRVADIRSHQMHSERYVICDKAAELINQTRQTKGRIIAVGTTCVRTLEYTSNQNGRIQAGTGECDLFIYPGYRFKIVDAMITNFHLPKSTLLMLVSAFAGRERILKAYHEAIAQKYRFFSYGDAMFIG